MKVRRIVTDEVIERPETQRRRRGRKLRKEK
jgi:hypothetical protein